MPVIVSCENCGKEFSVLPARKHTARFCSYACRGKWRSKNWTGSNHPNWTGGERVKACEYCGKDFFPTVTIATFRKQRFCSRECGWKGQKYHRGKNHPHYKPDSRRNKRSGKHGSWARAVLSRDKATCQHCGAQDIELHAHHIKPFKDYPELRWDLSNGLTLCYRCHWNVHTASTENAVNSGNTLTDGAEGNPEPSFGRKPIEGVTTRGRAYRRWNGACDFCGAFISKRWSDTVGKRHLFCSRQCAGKFRRKAVTSSTSAAPEKDDIV